MLPDLSHLAETPHGKVGLAFAIALVDGDFEAAYDLLSPKLRNEYSVTQLQAIYEEMIAYGDGAPTEIMVMNLLDDWAMKRPDDLGWAYVAIAGNGYSEAVTVVVDQNLRIRDIEWGRP